MMVDSPPYAYSARTSRAGAALLCSPPRRASAGQPSPLDSPLLAKLSFPAFASSSHSAELGSPMVPAPRTRLTRRAQPTARPIPIEDDDDGSVFLSSPTHTPVKRAVSQRAALSPLAINPLVAVPPRTGAKRKPAPATSNGNTPVGRTPPTMTPLKTAGGPFALDRLAPLAAPSFVDRDRTPQTKADADGLLRSQTASMTRLRIGDRTVDDGLEFGTPEDVEKVVPSAVSPDGHVTKRRVRSRPVSTDLRDMILIPASPPPIPVSRSVLHAIGVLTHASGTFVPFSTQHELLPI
jgi:mitosis inhibitor protein kinase SWE1